MPDIARSAHDMISRMDPRLRAGAFVFVTLSAPAPELAAQAIACFAEDEGLSLILPLDLAARAGCDTKQPMRCITLHVHSALDGVGLTAAVAGVLADNGIACNMVAAFHHDHVFVPAADADRALALLRALQAGA
jgi:hypothetical protein